LQGLSLCCAELRAEQLHLIVGRLGEEVAGPLDGRDCRIVTVQAVKGRKPEELVAANLAAHAEAPGNLMIGWGKGLGGENGNGG
jgi:hypothetical protein